MNLMSVTLKEAATAVMALGSTNTVILEGQPGIGKSSILKGIAAAMPDLQPAYIDCSTLDLGDLGMPMVDRENGVTNYAPNARFHISSAAHRPVIIMLDELGKAPRPVQNMLLPLIQERRLGSINVHPGSIILATTNLATDGVGDSIQAHAYNRMVRLVVKNPDADEWLQWADGADIASEVRTFARQFPQVFASYVDTPKSDNPYIFDPRKGQVRQFCSPRSLEAASNIVKKRHILGDTLTLSTLAGAVGEAAARDMEAMLSFSRNLPTNAAIVADPVGAPQPGDGVEAFYMAFRLAATLDKANVAAFTKYVDRFASNEAKVLFMTTALQAPARQAIAAMHRPLVEVATKLGKFF